MGRLYFDKRFFAEKKTKWVSFETSSGLKRTRSDIYGKCVPCITNLYEQLKTGKTEIRLGSAYRCWKIVVSLPDNEECVRFLEEFESRFLGDMDVKGRFGSGDPSKSTRVIVFNAEGEPERDRLLNALRACARTMDPVPEVTYHRACADLYHALLGDWSTWSEREVIKNPALIEPTIAHIREVLFWDKKE